ncbi:HBS1-like protein [Clavelina lepadiformis]|uniref:HBS1-like protein n=1 Tax=Clavelina lepadiformis TaxID=159417 RepID=UPI0040435F47
MSRHRNVRNAKNYDYDDDYDIYGHSYDDDYCVSPGTLQQYSYSRSSGRGVQFGSYMPSEDTVEEEVGEEEKSYHRKEYQEDTMVNHHKSVIGTRAIEKLNGCLELMRNVVGENYAESEMKDAAINCNFDCEQAINYLLNSAHRAHTFSNDDSSSNQSHVTTTTSSTCKLMSDAVPMPQRTHRRGRRSKQGDTSTTLDTISKPKTDPVDLVITKMTKAANTSLAPAKTGFCITGSPDSSNSACQLAVHNVQNGTVLTIDSSMNKDKQLEKAKCNLSSKSDLVSTPKRRVDGNESAPSTPGKQVKNLINYTEEYSKRMKDEKQQISMVVIGHVDAGKSTMMGHLLFQKGVISKRLIHKYEQESRKQGKASFAYAWVLDETGEERARGVTMDVAHNYFETSNRIVTLMDAPGHRDFIPNMISGASQADVAVLVVGASTNEFEAGFGIGGQTREHALLVRSLGVVQLAVAVNKLDTVDWSKKRFDEIVEKLKQFLKQAGFRESDVTYVPVSGLLGENLAEQAKNATLCSWYKGPCLLEVIDRFRPPTRPVDYALRFCVNDVYRGQGSGIYISGKIESGGVCPGTKVEVMPASERGLVKGVEVGDERNRSNFALAGEHATLILTGIDAMKVTNGSVICDADNPIRAVTRLQARIVVFNIEVPITRGFPVELHYKAVSEPAVIRRIHSQLHKSTGEVIAKKPKVLLKGHNALVEVEVTRPVCLEEYAALKELGRFTLRYGGSTIAACVVMKLL